MKTPLIPISWGELFDKLTILQIKLNNLRDRDALRNVKIEHDQLYVIYNSNFLEDKKAKLFIADLKQINEKLWDIEDGKRSAEKNNKFDEKFIELARNVYKFNDKRAKIKLAINNALGSNIKEVKSYE